MDKYAIKMPGRDSGNNFRTTQEICEPQIKDLHNAVFL
jgi:hypothetical protein